MASVVRCNSTRPRAPESLAKPLPQGNGLSECNRRPAEEVTEIAPIPTGNQRNLFSHQVVLQLCLALSLFLAGLSGKLWLIGKAGSSLPQYDAWGAEGSLHLLYQQGQLGLAELSRAHNEHRIFLSRVYSLALLLVNRQWDNQVQTVANAIVHCGTLAGLGWLLGRLMGKRAWFFIWPPLAVMLVLPFGWENTLVGFQSCFYLLLLSSLLTIWLLGFSEPVSARWWLGAAAGMAGLFTLSSGLLSVGPVVALVVLDLWRRRETLGHAWPTVGVCLLIVTLGLLLQVDVAAHHVLRAHSLPEFVIALAKNLAWPWVVMPPFAVVALLPLALLAWVCLVKRRELLAPDRLIVALIMWVLLQGAAAAYARGAGGHPPQWRYMDTSSFVLLVDCLCIGRLLTAHREFIPLARLSTAVFAVWAIGSAAGLGLLTQQVWGIVLKEHNFYSRVRLESTRAFVAKDDPAPILARPQYSAAPQDPQWLITFLRNPAIRKELPACVRPPLTVIPARTEAGAFITNGVLQVNRRSPTEPCWGSYSAGGAKARGTFESLPVARSNLPFLEIPVIGELGRPDLSLGLVELATGHVTAVKPRKMPGNQWQNVQVKAPRGEFKLIARDESEAGWFGFKQPRELGRLSFYAAELVSAWGLVLFLGLGCLLLTIALCFASDRNAKTQSRL